jgi:hypothetical protein
MAPGHAQILPAAWYLRVRVRMRVIACVRAGKPSLQTMCKVNKFVTFMISRLPKTTRKTIVCPTAAAPHRHVDGLWGAQSEAGSCNGAEW